MILGLGALILSPIPMTPLKFADEYSMWGISCGANVLSAFSLTLIGVYGLTCRPRFELAREVLTSMIICCVGILIGGPIEAWLHWTLSAYAQLLSEGIFSLVLLNASFALIATQLPLKGRWWLFSGLQLIALTSVSVEFFESDRRFVLMLEVFSVLVIVFSLIRVWRVDASSYLRWHLVSLSMSWVVGGMDEWILNLTHYWVSGHTLQHLCWSASGFFWLKYFTQVRPRELNALLPN